MSNAYLLNSSFMTISIKQSVGRFWKALDQHGGESLLILILGFFSLSGFWIWSGSVRRQKKHLRGMEEVSPKQLTSYLKRQKKASSLTLAGVPLLKNSETEHILLSGTTGTGKSTCCYDLTIE